MHKWQQEGKLARLEEILSDGSVKCHLSPRNCVIKEGGHGFCGVRGNRGGRLTTFNYGKGVHPTEETIETEAVNHFSPGERILSLGNIGCMLNCSYCHNWKTSQAKYVSDKDIHYLSPESVVDLAIRHGIRCLSWTYNDPVVWHEFILDTAKLAKENGLINLYKSAFYITPEAVEELLPVMDIFSISIKSMNPDYYRKITKGTLEPVLEATEQVFKAGKHLEVSTLMVTDLSDDEKTALDVSNWVLNKLSPSTPLHLVRFHPDYRYTNTTRTPINRLESARTIAIEAGLQHVYLGNVYDTPYSSTLCRQCDNVLVTRYGLNAKALGLDASGCCANCGLDAHFKLLPPLKSQETQISKSPQVSNSKQFLWHGDIRSIHAQLKNSSERDQIVYYRRLSSNQNSNQWSQVPLCSGESYRFIIAKSSIEESGVEIAIPEGIVSNLHEVFDRAHFPTTSIEEISPVDDVTPLPKFSSISKHSSD